MTKPVLDVWSRRAAALVVAAVAAYASYEHQYSFAVRGGADGSTASLWPLSVDGLLILATAGLLKAGGPDNKRVRLVSWLAFGLGIGVSLAANIASAPTLAWQPVLVAGWPPVALLLAVELLTERTARSKQDETETVGESHVEAGLAEPEDETRRPARAEALMWEYFQNEFSQGRTPTGAELDRVAGTNNFGRAVLRRWRRAGRIPPPSLRVAAPGGTELTTGRSDQDAAARG